MSDEATIEDEVDVEQQTPSSRPQTKTGLLPWAYIFEIATKQWAIFLILSLAIAVYLYVNAQRRQNKKETSSTIRHDHIQGGTKGISRKAPTKRE